MNNNYSIIRKVSQDSHIRKFVFKCIKDSATFETSSFLIIDRNRHDLCVSTMAGCPLKCLICSTTFSPIAYQRNLSSKEICLQVSAAIEERDEIKPDTTLRIGFMGNGEPFLNSKAMQDAIYTMVFKNKYPIGEIAVSTIGVNINTVYNLNEISQKIGIGIKLQLSLISIESSVRQVLMPNAPSIELIQEKLDWYALESHIPVRYNVPLISGINNSQEHLKKLVDFLMTKPHLRRLKLAAFNTFPGISLKASPDEELIQTYKWLENLGLTVDLFIGDRDNQVFASCGQMRSSVMQ